MVEAGTVLLIEDEPVVMKVIRALLEMLGYRVLGAKTGREAVNIAEIYKGEIHLALLDIRLPDMEGEELYPIITKARPDMKVIVCSGLPVDGPVRQILAAGAQDFLQKPFSIKTLSEKLHHVFGESHSCMGP